MTNEWTRVLTEEDKTELDGKISANAQSIATNKADADRRISANTETIATNKADADRRINANTERINAIYQSYSTCGNIGDSINCPISANRVAILIQGVFYRSIDMTATYQRVYSLRKNGVQFATATAVFKTSRMGGAGFGRNVNVSLQTRYSGYVSFNPNDRIQVVNVSDTYSTSETLSDVFTVYFN